MTAGSNCATDFIENKIINSFLRAFNVTSASPYIGLFTSTTDSGYETGSPVEVSAVSYKRVTASGIDQYSSVILGGPIGPPIPAPYWIVAGGSATNMYELNFPPATSSWGNVCGICITTGSASMTSGSRMYFYSNPETIYSPVSSLIYALPIYSMRIFLSEGYSAYLANSLLNWFLNSQEISQPGTSVNIALFTNLPDIYGNNGDEVPEWWWRPNPLPGVTESESTGYSRKFIAGTDYWNNPSIGYTYGTATLLSNLQWTATGDWGIVEGFCIFESVHNNMLFRGVLDRPRQVLNGDSFKIGSFKVSLG